MKPRFFPSSDVFLNPVMKSPPQYLLDKNELSDDLNKELKYRVVDHLLDTSWNRYPSADCSDLEQAVARYVGVKPENIALGAGSAGIIANLLNYVAIQRKNLVIVQPTYALFEHHCRSYGIPFTPWYLKEDLTFNFDALPMLDAQSVLVITSPNNPVGNTLNTEELENLLCRFPDTLIVLDNVYHEFSDTDFAPLIELHENLLILRSFSKAFPVAGLRLGYVCAAPALASMVKRLSLNYMLNHFTQTLAREVLFTPECLHDSRQRVRNVILQREQLFRSISEACHCEDIEVFPSGGNFLLIKVKHATRHSELLSAFQHAGIRVLDASGFPMLQQCIRISVGNYEENMAVLEILLNAFGQEEDFPFSIQDLGTFELN